MYIYIYIYIYMAGQKQDDQLEHTYSSFVRIRDVALKTSQRRWTIGRSGERESGISVLVAWHDDDDIWKSYEISRQQTIEGWFYILHSSFDSNLQVIKSQFRQNMWVWKIIWEYMPLMPTRKTSLLLLSNPKGLAKVKERACQGVTCDPMGTLLRKWVNCLL